MNTYSCVYIIYIIYTNEYIKLIKKSNTSFVIGQLQKVADLVIVDFNCTNVDVFLWDFVIVLNIKCAK